ncbi:3-deoxy-D-manno-octulosonic acid transferase [Roseibium aquae]|uniref:3-deoxy-D-manno-octulosonic acid transferase n=1 Tax=Roseibium aquae TaxID=1323746 RepID=A0A916TKN6_9HYPH|nr:3-deoxy-D-manno-octulosonic acid transferase [Roseibium aquae]GGB52391.1 3-deoxy-D-manno-octulosonic acid transferase [Roseibium aquae]
MGIRPPILLRLYLLLARLAAPVYRIVHKVRVSRGKDEKVRGGEKFGWASQPRPSGSVIWVHAASVGETNSVLPLISALTDRGYFVLLTTVTRTSAEIAARNLPEGAGHQFVPFDSPSFVDRFLDHWRPSLALFVESEIWPAILNGLRTRRCRTILVNARLSVRSVRSWKRLGAAATDLLGHFDLILAQSRADEGRFASLGVKTVTFAGNLKFDADLPTPDPRALSDLKRALGTRPVWLAALTHPGEEEIALAAHREILKSHPDSLLLLAPRHPDRRETIIRELEAAGLPFAVRSTGDLPGPGHRLYLCDTLGEMNTLYSAVPIAFLGGSFAEVGGHNPVEAIRFKAALVSGPKVANARTLYKHLWDNGAAVKVDSPSMLARPVQALFENGPARATQISRALEIVEEGRGALSRCLSLLGPFLPPSGRVGGE